MDNVDILYKEFADSRTDLYGEKNDKFDLEAPYRESCAYYIDNMLVSITYFRNYIGTYLSDLSRSDRSFIEGRSMNHPSIGSLTKLLFGYNQYINKLVEITEKENSENYAFVVVSGGCDNIRVAEIFSFLKSDENYKHLYVVTLPEVCLFDFKETLLALGHECFHCIGKKYRKKRYDFFVQTICRYIAFIISDVIKLEALPTIIAEDKKNDVSNKMQSLTEELRDKLFEELKKLIDPQMEIFLKNKKEEDIEICYSNSITNALDMIREHMLCEIEYIKNRDGCFYDIVFKEVYEVLYKEYAYIVNSEDVCDKYHHIVLNDILAEIDFYIRDKSKPEEIIDGFKVLIYKIFTALKSPDDLNALETYEHNFPENHFCDYINDLGQRGIISYEVIANYIMKVMCECYADCMTIDMLRATPTDFIFGFLYQAWDIDRAFPYNIITILRIGINLKLHYKITGPLDDKLQNEIRDRFDNYMHNTLIDCDVVKYGCINADKIIDRINLIVEKYKIYEYYCKPIEEYIELCHDIIKNDTVYSDYRNYRKIKNFDNLRHNIIYGFIDIWRNFAQE